MAGQDLDHAIVSGVSHVDVALLVDRDGAGLAEAVSELTQELAICRERDDAVVPGVRYEDMAPTVDRDAASSGYTSPSPPPRSSESEAPKFPGARE
jgi:hypothetical protein